MKNYILIVSALAVIGIALLFENYPVIIGLSCFGVGLQTKFLADEESKKGEKNSDNDVIDSS